MADANNLADPAKMVPGRVPPSDLDAEGIVLSACLLEPGDIDVVIGLGLTPEHFYSDANRRVAESIFTIHGEPSMVVDIVAIASDLRYRGRLDQIGGTPYLALLANAQPVVGEKHLAQHVRRVMDLWRARQAISIQQVSVARLYVPDGTPTQELLESLEEEIWTVTHPSGSSTYENAGEIAHTSLTTLAELLRNGGGGIDLTTGFPALDEVTTGWHPGELTVVAARPGQGKCLGRGTPVLKYDGSIVPVEEVKVGDLLMGPDSQPRHVLSTTKDIGPLWQVTPTKGEPWVCNWCHVLTMVHSSDSRVIDMPLDEYLTQGQKFKHQHKLFSVGVDFPKVVKELPIAPYALGLWLGDGTKQYKFTITKPDLEIRPDLEKLARAEGLTIVLYEPKGKCSEVHIRGRSPGRRSSPLITKLRELFPDMKNISIPRQYLVASRRDRLELLAGLIDTDGHISQKNVEIAQRSTGIAEGIRFLARSLGMRVTSSVKVVNGVGYQRLFISGDLTAIPTRIPRKKLVPRLQKKSALRTGFKLAPIGDGEYFGFTLDGDGRFLLGDFTVTHNTAWCCSSILRSTALPKDGSLPEAAYLHSLEMPKETIALRLVCTLGGVEFQRIRLNHLTAEDWQKLYAACKILRQQAIYVDDKPAITVAEFRSNIRKIKREIALGRIKAKRLLLVAVDYLQLMQGEKGQGREREVSSLSQGLKNISKTESVAVLALAQLNRAVEKRGGSGPDKQKRPELSDLRESGAIEQDADTIMFIFRPKYYDKEANDDAELIVGKNRNGPTTTAVLEFDGATMTFRSKATGYEEFDEYGDGVPPAAPEEEHWYDK